MRLIVLEAKKRLFHFHLMTIFSSLKSILTTAPRPEERWSRSEELGIHPLTLNQVQSIAPISFYYFTVECTAPPLSYPAPANVSVTLDVFAKAQGYEVG